VQDQEIELMEIDGVWQVRTPKRHAKPRAGKSRLGLILFAGTAWLWVAILARFAMAYLGDAYHGDIETAGITLLFVTYLYAFIGGLRRR